MGISTVLACFLLFLTPLQTTADQGVREAIRLAYNFEFSAANRILKTHLELQGTDPEAHICRIVVDFLLLQQDPRPANLTQSFTNLEAARSLASQLQRTRAGPESDFFSCLVQYYLMKTSSLDKRWLATVASASQSRRLALDLERHSDRFPDVLYILGDQDYTATLVPAYLKPLFRAFNFRTDRAAGLESIRQASRKDGYTKYEASQLDITLTTYIEKDYPRARARANDFLVKFPENLSVRYMYIDILLRESDIESAMELLSGCEQAIRHLPATSKWRPRHQQMRGNLLNAQGQFRQAISAYTEALGNPNISAVSVGELYLETGKLYDILGERAAAQAAYQACIRSDGLEVHKEEARQYQRQSWPYGRGSY